jgi:hypothetical protein
MSSERAQCKATAKNGAPCKAAPMASGLCFLHGNPNKASELGRIGGKQNRRERRPGAYALPKLDGLGSASERLQWIFDETMAGSMPPAVANVLMKVTESQTRVWEKTTFEQQIAELQEQVNTLKSIINIRDSTNSISESESDEPSSEL